MSTGQRMTKFERARLIGTRADQISRGAPVLVTVPRGMTSVVDIAELELAQKKIPLIVRRYLPGGAYEDCDANALLPPCPETWSPSDRGASKRDRGDPGRGETGERGSQVSALRRSRRGIKRRIRDSVAGNPAPNN